MASNLNEYYNSQGKPLPSVSERAGVYASMGLGDAKSYVGTAQQNSALLAKLSSSAPAVTATPTPKVTTPAVTQVNNAPATVGVNNQPAVNTGGGFDSNALAQALVSKGYNEADARNASTGPRASELAKEYLGIDSGGLGGAMSSILGNAPTIDLQSLYNKNFKTPEITTANDELNAKLEAINAKKKDIADATTLLSDNPFNSESALTGKVAKTQDKGNKELNTMIDEYNAVNSRLVNLKADAQIQLDLAMKQYDINSDTYKDNFNKFNTLLASGALDNLSGTDSAQLGMTLGIPATMIQSAVDAQKTKNMKTSIIQSEDASGNVTYTVINSDTGDVIASKNLGQIGKGREGGSTKTDTEQAIKLQLSNDAQGGKTLTDLIKVYGTFLDPSQVFQIYNMYNYGDGQGKVGYGRYVETPEQLGALGIKTINNTGI